MPLLQVETEILKQLLRTNKHAVGFISFEYIDESISTIDINGVEATAENVLKQTYKLSTSILIRIQRRTINGCRTTIH